jgi:NitT/TauT family transport system permease protein
MNIENPWARAATRAALVLAFLVLWEFAPESVLPPTWVSRPSHIAATMSKWLLDGSLWFHLQVTFAAMLSGYAIGVVTGVAAGLLLGLLPRFEHVMSPFITALYSLPKIAIAPLLVVLFGIGIESKIILVAITVFFMMMYSALDGLRDVDRDLLGMLRLMGATRVEAVRKVLLPGSLPWIFNGLRVSIRLAFTAAILGEIISSNRGIGYLVEYSAVKYDGTGVFAAIAVVVILSVAITELISLAESSNSRWRMSGNLMRAR